MQFQPHLNLISAIVLFGVIQAWMLSFIFIRKGAKSSSLFLGMIMLVLGLIELESFLNYSGFMMFTPHLVNISPPLIFLLGPLILFHTKKTMAPHKDVAYRYLHLAPAGAYFLYSFFFYLQPTGFKVGAFMKTYHPEYSLDPVARLFPTDPLHIQGLVVIEGLSVHLLAYVVASLFLVFSYSPHTAPSSLRKNGKNLAWVKFLCVNVLVGSIIFLLTGGIVNGYVLFKRILPPYMVDLYSTFLVYSISVYWLGRVIIPEESTRRYAKSEIPLELRQQKVGIIREIMEREKPYKEVKFSLDTLAEKVALSSHHLSQVINLEMGMTFVEFINFYRIEEAQKILKGPQNKDVKVENLAYELGYQSKSAFFNAFRRQTDTTPARFRENEVFPHRNVPKPVTVDG